MPSFYFLNIIFYYLYINIDYFAHFIIILYLGFTGLIIFKYHKELSSTLAKEGMKNILFMFTFVNQSYPQIFM